MSEIKDDGALISKARDYFALALDELGKATTHSSGCECLCEAMLANHRSKKGDFSDQERVLRAVKGLPCKIRSSMKSLPRFDPGPVRRHK